MREIDGLGPSESVCGEKPRGPDTLATTFRLSHPNQHESEPGTAGLAFNAQLPIVRSLPQHT